MERLACVMIGYACGNFLTAYFAIRWLKNQNIFEVGSGNPGMANVMTEYGFKTGILVLAGDLAKTGLACLIAWLFFRTRLSIAWTGLACIVGHNFPLWHQFKGGKGVTCTCLVLLLIHPVFGLFAVIAGMLTVFLTKYLALGGILIPLFFTVCACTLGDTELIILCVVMTLLMFLRHREGLVRIQAGTEKQVDVIGAIKKKLKKK